MATKKATNPQLKLLITAMKKTVCFNSVLPILEDILFEPGFAIVTDLENSVRVPYEMKGLGRKKVCVPAKMFEQISDMLPNMIAEVDKDFGVIFLEGSRKAKVMGENPDNFPKTPLVDKEYRNIGKLSAEDMEHLETALCFVSGDDLRPAMTGILFEKKGIDKKSRIVTTDAHRLYWNNLSSPLAEDFIMPAKAAKILMALGGEWEITTDSLPDKEVTHACFTRADGTKVVTRVIDARFPDYKVVVPIGEGLVKLFATPEFLIKELKNAGKFANKSTNQVTFGMNGKFKVASQDVDFSFEYESEFENKNEVEFAFHKDYPKQYTLNGNRIKIIKDHGAVVEIAGEYSYSVPEKVMKADLVLLPPDLYIGFNAKFMIEAISKLPKDTAVEIDMWSPTKAAIINKNFLLMPLMLLGND